MPKVQRDQAPETWMFTVDGFETHLIAIRRLPSTVRTRVHAVIRFAKDTGLPSPDVVTTEDVECYFREHQYWKANSARQMQTALRTFYSWAFKKGFVPHDPVAELEHIRVPAAVPMPCTDEAIAIGLLTDDPRVVVMILLAAGHGLRRCELAVVHKRDLIAMPNGLQLVVHGKGEKVRFVPIDDSEHEIIDWIRNAEGYIFPGQIEGHLSPDRVGELVSDALPAPWSTHKLRHAFGTKVFAMHGNLLTLQGLMGHASPVTTAGYALVSNDEARSQAAAAIIPRPPREV